METATCSDEPVFVPPDMGRARGTALAAAASQNKTRPAPLQEAGGIGSVVSLDQHTTVEMTQVEPTDRRERQAPAARFGEGVGVGASYRSLGGQARVARPALGRCERYGCDEQAGRFKTLWCGHEAALCQGHSETEW